MNPVLVSGVILGSGPAFNFNLVVTAFKLSCTKYSGSVLVNTIMVLLDVIDDLPMRYGFIIIWSDSAVFGFV